MSMKKQLTPSILIRQTRDTHQKFYVGQRRRRWSSIKTALGNVSLEQYLAISSVADIIAVNLYSTCDRPRIPISQLNESLNLWSTVEAACTDSR